MYDTDSDDNNCVDTYSEESPKIQLRTYEERYRNTKTNRGSRGANETRELKD